MITYGELVDRFGSDLDYFGLTSMFKSSPYDKIYELGKTAVERFGNDPKTFRETLKKFEPKKFREIIKETAKLSSSDSLRFNSGNVREYVNCLTAILQVDLECPGFIKNFPEALNYLRAVNSNNTNQIIFDFGELYNKTITPFNRYSGKSDFKYVKKLFEIPDEDENKRYDERDPRFDDYISIWFLKFWKSGNEEQRDYLKKYYIYQETLLPEDYQNLISYSGILKKGEVDLEKGDLRWIDLYFERIDEIIESVHKNIDTITPPIMKKINLTLT